MVPVTGVAAIGVDTGGITIITTIHIMDGVEATGEVVMDGHVRGIPIIAPIDILIQALLILVVQVADIPVAVPVVIILEVILVIIHVVVEITLVVHLDL